MRILWNDNENWFQAELGLNEHWRDDMELIRSVGFKSTGPPDWIWHTTKTSVLNKLREQPPKTGLTITELALQKYKLLDEQYAAKIELKKRFDKARAEAAQPKWETYQDQETGLKCFLVKPADEVFHMKYDPPAKPEVYCFVCGEPIYWFEYPDLCIWCNKSENNT